MSETVNESPLIFVTTPSLSKNEISGVFMNTRGDP